MPEIASIFATDFFYICISDGLIICRLLFMKAGLTLGALILIDYLANFIELLVRLELSSLVLHMQSGIFLAAVMRSCLTWLVMLLFEKYRLFLVEKEHEKRYQKLVLLFSNSMGKLSG